MPIYEFYCSDCHTIFSFLARVATTRRPTCPRCERQTLERRPSAFAVVRATPFHATDDPGRGTDGLETTMAQFADEAAHLRDDDPRGMARLARRLYDRAGMGVNEPMEEALRRLEAGEDPDQIESEMGELLDGAPFLDPAELTSLRPQRHQRAPRTDEALYEL